MSDEPFGTQSIRKLMMAAAFITFTIYIALKSIYNWRHKGVNSEGLSNIKFQKILYLKELRNNRLQLSINNLLHLRKRFNLFK